MLSRNFHGGAYVQTVTSHVAHFVRPGFDRPKLSVESDESRLVFRPQPGRTGADCKICPTIEKFYFGDEPLSLRARRLSLFRRNPRL